MKKLFLVPLLFVLCLLSCKKEYNILEYQNNNIEASCTVNEGYNINIIKSNDLKRLEVCSPDTLKGILFEIRGDKAYAIKNEMEIPLSPDSLKGICALLNCFSLLENDIINVSENNVITYKNSYGLYTITYGENSLPQQISIIGDTYEYNITVNGIKLIK